MAQALNTLVSILFLVLNCVYVESNPHDVEGIQDPYWPQEMTDCYNETLWKRMDFSSLGRDQDFKVKRF